MRSFIIGTASSLLLTSAKKQFPIAAGLKEQKAELPIGSDCKKTDACGPTKYCSGVKRAFGSGKCENRKKGEVECSKNNQCLSSICEKKKCTTPECTKEVDDNCKCTHDGQTEYCKAGHKCNLTDGKCAKLPACRESDTNCSCGSRINICKGDEKCSLENETCAPGM